MTTTSAPAPATPSRSRRIIAISLAIIAALVVGFFVFANLYADWQWYAQLGFEGVLLTQWTARVVMFLVGFVGMAVPVWLALQLAYRLRPVYARLSSQLDRYQEVVDHVPAGLRVFSIGTLDDALDVLEAVRDDGDLGPLPTCGA